ncbi:MAG: heavy metal translocating P-type ATPase [Treponema sp.]|nr:heavy metal translocating P-type ATPase [Treponema sp.]
MKEETYIITGMSCAACSSAVERVTRKLEGVEESNVNLATGRMTIRYDQEKVNPQQIMSKVERAGFGCQPYIQEQRGPQQEQSKDKFHDTQHASSHGKEHSTSQNSQNAKSPATQDKELQEKKHRLLGAWGFTLALMYVSMGSMLPTPLPLPELVQGASHPSNFALLQLLLTIPVLFYGRFFYSNGFSALFHGNPNMNSLVAVGSLVSFIYSLAITFLVADNPHQLHHLYYESATMVLTFVMTGKYLEEKSKKKTGSAITALMELTPPTAFLLKNGNALEIPAEQLVVGDLILVKPGSRIPADGEIVQGASGVDESMLTGESLPVEKSIGSTVTGGSMNLNGALQIRVSRVGKDSTLAKIVAFMEEAQGKKAPIAKIADRVSGIFVPVVMAIAAVAAVVWFIAGKDVAFVLQIFTSVLVIACPCALGLATPAAIMVGTGLGATNGILLRSGEALEMAGKTTAVVLDKTGTVTQGKPRVTQVLAADGVDKAYLLSLVAAVESQAQHPLAQAILDEAEKLSCNKNFSIPAFETIPGKGIKATIQQGATVLVGSIRLMEESGCRIPQSLEQISQKLPEQGHTLVYAATQEVQAEAKILGLIAIADSIRETSLQAVKELKSMGITTILLTGDNKGAAEAIGQQVQVDRVIAQVLPQEKAQVIEELQKEGHIVMMVGDGINDAPALVQADSGVAMGGGSDIAVEAGEVILMGSSLLDVAKTIRLSKLTITNIRQNLFWAFLYNTIGIPVAAGLLYPFTGQLMSPMLAALAMSLSSVCVVSNALRLRKKQL